MTKRRVVHFVAANLAVICIASALVAFVFVAGRLPAMQQPLGAARVGTVGGENDGGSECGQPENANPKGAC